MFFLSASLYAFIYLCLHACNSSLPISSVQNSDTSSENWAAAEKADRAAYCANFSIANTTARFPEQICKKPLYSAQYAHIQKKAIEIYADVLTDQVIPTGVVEVEGIMPKIRKYAYKLCEYLLAMKIALEQPRLVANSNVLYIAQSIIHYSTFILDTNDLTNYIHSMLQRVAPTIVKSYSRHIADFLLNHADATPAYHASSDHVMDMLQSILTYAYATIHELDTKYYKTDAVFFTTDPFKWLRNNAYNASKKARDTNKKGKNVWEFVFTHHCSLQELEQAFDYTLEARSAAKNARNAYRHFAEYFDQFIPSIQTMLNSCNALIHTTQPTANSYTSYLKTCLNNIRMTKSDIQEVLDRLTDMIWNAHQAANQYNNSYVEYGRFIRKMKYTICTDITKKCI
ncbi:hypothetical protein [Cardinium endosymbiont of Nabis limbatus]|uniref:hypothetical protein n=1 Tax=Cardinium endosymbiont of Nabis limbatus TaxID=3066217 RepID=UPI003AF36E1D